MYIDASMDCQKEFMYICNMMHKYGSRMNFSVNCKMIIV